MAKSKSYKGTFNQPGVHIMALMQRNNSSKGDDLDRKFSRTRGEGAGYASEDSFRSRVLSQRSSNSNALAPKNSTSPSDMHSLKSGQSGGAKGSVAASRKAGSVAASQKAGSVAASKSKSKAGGSVAPNSMLGMGGVPDGGPRVYHIDKLPPTDDKTLEERLNSKERSGNTYHVERDLGAPYDTSTNHKYSKISCPVGSTPAPAVFNMGTFLSFPCGFPGGQQPTHPAFPAHAGTAPNAQFCYADPPLFSVPPDGGMGGDTQAWQSQGSGGRIPHQQGGSVNYGNVNMPRVNQPNHANPVYPGNRASRGGAQQACLPPPAENTQSGAMGFFCKHLMSGLCNMCNQEYEQLNKNRNQGCFKGPVQMCAPVNNNACKGNFNSRHNRDSVALFSCIVVQMVHCFLIFSVYFSMYLLFSAFVCCTTMGRFFVIFSIILLLYFMHFRLLHLFRWLRYWLDFDCFS